MHVTFTLLPTALAVLPGLVRACLRVKRLLPAAILPGWFLMVAPPFYLLLAVVGLIALNHMAGSPFLILGILLWIGAPMVYVWRSDLFVRSLLVDECGQINRVQRIANVFGVVGGLLLLAYLFTKQVFGLHLVGLDVADLACLVVGKPRRDTAQTWRGPCSGAIAVLAGGHQIVPTFYPVFRPIAVHDSGVCRPFGANEPVGLGTGEAVSRDRH